MSARAEENPAGRVPSAWARWLERIRAHRPPAWALPAFAGFVAVTLATIAVLAPGPRAGIAGLSVDTLFLLRDTVFGQRRPAADAKVAVILIDEATYHLPPFDGLSKELWLPYFATVLKAVNEAQPKAIGLDFILTTSPDRFQRGYEREFLLALRGAAEQKRLVLAKMQAQGPLIQPSPGQRRAANGGENIRSVNLPQDADGVVRTAPLLLPRADGGPPETAFAYELARRADPTLPAPRAPEMLVNYDGGAPFLTFSLADIHACAEAGKADFFSRQFKDRVVLLATGLDVEDRLMTARRFINRGEGHTGPRCTPEPGQGLRQIDFARATMPGVFVHAAAIDNLLRREVLDRPGGAARIGIVAGVAGIAAVPALALPIGWAAGALALLLVAIVAIATVAFQLLLALPLIEALGAAILTFALLLAFRFAVSDRDKRRIRHMFGLYLAPSVIERMIATGQLPALGGERREMTFLFSDIAGFTTMTEAADPAVLLPALNTYMEGVFDVVMNHGGLVMDFAGDGVLALFGAPADQPDHAARAVACARAMDEFTEQFRAQIADTGLLFGHTRIGLHTGEATVGNFGAARRLKYTAMGDVVNAASRLEGLNKYFGTRVCMSDATRAASGDVDIRPLGSFFLKGKAQALDVYQLLPPGSDQDPDVIRYRKAYAALARGDAAAEAEFAALATTHPEDGAIGFHLSRARAGTLSVSVHMEDK